MKTKTEVRSQKPWFKHSPAPWIVAQSWNDYESNTIAASDGKCVCAVASADSVKVSPVEAANARLIAAAPELLAALEDAQRILFNVGWPEKFSKERETIREAIAKATGN